jgi:hypothetical protein
LVCRTKGRTQATGFQEQGTGRGSGALLGPTGEEIVGDRGTVGNGVERYGLTECCNFNWAVRCDYYDDYYYYYDTRTQETHRSVTTFTIY